MTKSSRGHRRNGERWYKTTWGIGLISAIATVLAALIGLLGIALSRGPSSAPSASTSGTVAAPPTTIAGPRTTIGSSSTTVGGARIASVVSAELVKWTPSPRYDVEVRITNRPPSGQSLWLVALIYPDGVKIKDMLYFAKSPVPSAPDIYPIKIKYCRVLRTDLQRGLQVVAADAEASKILANNRAEEDNPDTCSTNSDLTSLPVGAMPVSDAYKFYASP